MGCDIHTYVEILRNGIWERHSLRPFMWRDYSVFGFLAGVRNYSAVVPLAHPRGLPPNVSSFVADEREAWGDDGHSTSWLSLQELIDFDYDSEFEDRRVERQIGPNIWDGGCTADPGEGTMTTYREFLGSYFFKDLAELKALGRPEHIRVVFWFDN